MPKAYKRGEEWPETRTCETFSGSRTGPAGAAACGLGAPGAAGCQVSKSDVSNRCPEPVRIDRREPSGEYQTPSTGPDARPAAERSMLVFPIWRQEGGFCPRTAAAASKLAATTHTVAFLHMERVHCILNRQKVRLRSC